MPAKPEHTTPPTLTAGQQQRLLALARSAIAHYLETGESPTPNLDDPALAQPAGVFVTLRARGGPKSQANRLRGCIGHMEAERPLAELTAAMAIKAATCDPRFPPVTRAELDQLRLEISVLSPLRQLRHVADIQLGVDGLVIVQEPQRGLLLPHVPLHFGWSKEEYLAGICHKAGLPPDAWQTAHLFTFTTTTFAENEDS